jgi:hypothetical protein
MAKEIFYCDLTVLFNKKEVIVKDVVYKETDGYYSNRKLFKDEKVKVLKINIIKSLGFENISSDFTNVQKSNEVRNNITGAYD